MSDTDATMSRHESATETLRALLDERGVEWNDGGIPRTGTTFVVNGITWHAMWRDGNIELHCSAVTPQQAVDATLGRGECCMRLVYEEEDADGFIWPDHYECSACGANVHGIMPFYDTEIQPRYCPNCGRRVIGGDE